MTLTSNARRGNQGNGGRGVLGDGGVAVAMRYAARHIEHTAAAISVGILACKAPDAHITEYHTNNVRERSGVGH